MQNVTDNNENIHMIDEYIKLCALFLAFSTAAAIWLYYSQTEREVSDKKKANAF